MYCNFCPAVIGIAQGTSRATIGGAEGGGWGSDSLAAIWNAQETMMSGMTLGLATCKVAP